MQSVFVQNLVFGIMLIGALLILYMMLTEMINFLQTRVPFVPTAKKDLEDLAVRIGITKSDFVIDLGSGNGKVLFTLENLTGARGRGLQRAGWTQEYGRLRKWLSGSKIELISANFFERDWSEATVVYAYLYPPLMRSVGQKFREDCKAGTKLVCRDFYIPDWTPSQKWVTPSGHEMYLYLI